MGVPNRQIGESSSTENTLLHNILKQIHRLTEVIAASGGGGSGSVSTVSVVSANGFGGSVATPTSTPAITLTTSITGILKGNGTAISATIAGTDYSAGTSALATGLLKSTTGTGTLTIGVPGTDYLVQGTLKTGTVITFEGNNLYNTSVALTGNPTFSFTGAVVGVRVTVRHNDSVAPTMPGTAVYEGGTYRTGYDNYITFTYVSNSIVLYRFSQQNITLLDPVVNGTVQQMLFVDASGRINGDVDFTMTPSGANANIKIGQTAKTARVAIKAFTSGGNALVVTNNGDAEIFTVDATNTKLILGSAGASGPYIAATTDGTTTNNASRGILFNSNPAGNNQVGFQFNTAQSPTAGSASWNAPFKMLYTLTGTNGTGGSPITAKIPAMTVQYAGTLDANYTGDYVGLDVVSTLTIGASPSIFHSRFRSGRLGINTGTATPTGVLQVNGATGIPNLRLVGFATTTNYLADWYQSDGTTRAFGVQDNGDTFIKGSFTITDKDIILSATTGTKIGTATTQKLSLWNATPIVQPTTAITASTFVANTSGTVNDSATWDGYTIGQVVKALRNIGGLA